MASASCAKAPTPATRSWFRTRERVDSDAADLAGPLQRNGRIVVGRGGLRPDGRAAQVGQCHRRRRSRRIDHEAQRRRHVWNRPREQALPRGRDGDPADDAVVAVFLHVPKDGFPPFVDELGMQIKASGDLLH